MYTGNLTVVIAFRNEGKFLDKTVTSIRETSSEFLPIIIVDDSSDDGFDYKAVAEKHECVYYRSPYRIGSAGGKQVGSSLVDTEYFVFMDAHMKLFHQKWDSLLLEHLNMHRNSVVMSRTIPMHDEGGEMVLTRPDLMNGCYDGFNFGCYVGLTPGYEMDIEWIKEPVDEPDEYGLIVTPSLQGAVYGFYKPWWDYLHGFRGLYVYGMEENLIAIKSWLAGGSCHVVHNWGVGHLYMKVRPDVNFVDPCFLECNRLLLSHFLFDEKSATFSIISGNLRGRLGDRNFSRVMDMYTRSFHKMEDERVYFNTVCNKMGLSYFIGLNNHFIKDEEKRWCIEKSGDKN